MRRKCFCNVEVDDENVSDVREDGTILCYALCRAAHKQLEQEKKDRAPASNFDVV